jgi:hypothetical protein
LLPNPPPPLPAVPTVHVTVHLYRDDITTSVILSDTIIKWAGLLLSEGLMMGRIIYLFKEIFTGNGQNRNCVSK